ncbi:MAG: DUF3566 domain-containing protein [Acidimicrobiales bacterium]|nr:DUF3566 domain-containing protein [Acidimicrobiales bacterium]
MSTARTPVGGDAPDDGSDEPLADAADVEVADEADLAEEADDVESGQGLSDDRPSASDVDENPAGDTLVVELDDEAEERAEGDDPDTDVDGRPLGNELDAELEAEAAEMAPLVELPDRPHFAADEPPATDGSRPTPYRGDEVSVRVRGHGRVPARRVRRVIRRVDPLSVLKLAFFFNVCVFAMFLVAAVLLWSAAIGSGSTDNIESFLVDIGFEDFRLVGTDLFRGFFVFGGGMVIAFTVLAVLLALLFNLISDVVGGIRLTVIEPLVAGVDAEADGSQGAQAE